MPRPPRPNIMRALLGFPLGLVVMLLVVGFFRHFVQGMDAYLMPVEVLDGLFAGWFYEDEATLMFAILGGAFGFLWGSGATYDFEKEEHYREQSGGGSEIMKLPYIPANPDAPQPVRNNPAKPFLGALPGLALVSIVLVGTMLLLGVIPMADFLPTSTQTTNSAAERHEFGETDLNLLGLVAFENLDQGTAFIVISLLVIGGIVSLGLGLAVVVWLFNQMAASAQAADPDPEPVKDSLPVKLVDFFLDWVQDILNGIRGMLSPR
ncbi:MAG: hypothetical protein ACLFTK_01920 [Anaerolineales bacterium]